MSIRLLEHMRDELIATGIVQNTPEFCHSWLGRSEGYIRVLRYHNTEPSVETLSICSSKLGYYAARLAASDQPQHQAWGERLANLKALCDRAIATASRGSVACAGTDGGMSASSEMGSAAAKICAAVFCREVLIKSGWPFAYPTPVSWERT